MTKPKAPPQPRSISIDPNPKGELKRVGGSLADEWNLRLLNISAASVANSSFKNKEAITKQPSGLSGTMDMAPADPVEGILIAQLMAANEAALAMYSEGLGAAT